MVLQPVAASLAADITGDHFGTLPEVSSLQKWFKRVARSSANVIRRADCCPGAPV